MYTDRELVDERRGGNDHETPVANFIYSPPGGDESSNKRPPRCRMDINKKITQINPIHSYKSYKSSIQSYILLFSKHI